MMSLYIFGNPCGLLQMNDIGKLIYFVKYKNNNKLLNRNIFNLQNLLKSFAVHMWQ